AAGERISLWRGAEIFRETDSGRAGGVSRIEDGRAKPAEMARRPDGRRPRLSLRQAFFARGHSSVWLARFRRSGRPTARPNQRAHRSMVRPHRAAAFGEGVGVRVVAANAVMPGLVPGIR